MPWTDRKKRYASSRAWEAKHPDMVRSAKRNLRALRTAWYRTFKAVPCMDCGIQYPHYVMQFDHVRGDKAFHLSEYSNKSDEAVLAELAKCEVVCANCHFTRTWTRTQT